VNFAEKSSAKSMQFFLLGMSRLQVIFVGRGLTVCWGGQGEERLVCPWFSWFLRPPYIFLILGVISISAAVVFTFTGKVWVRFNGWVYRAKEPKWFWWEVALDYLIGFGFVGYFLFKISELSN
jgi:hypothetical protein